MVQGIGRRELLATLAGVLILAGLAWAWLGDSANYAPEATFHTLAGETLELNALDEGPVIVYFWATDCVTCMREMPDLIDLHDRLAGEGLTLIAVAMSHDDPDDLHTIRDRRAIPFPIVFDADGALARAFGNVRVTPTKLLIDGNGRIRMRHIGATNHDALAKRISALL